MSAAHPSAAVQMRPMRPDDLDAILVLEQAAHPHPWTRGHFADSLNPQFEAQCLWRGDALQGYFVAMRGFEEMHLLNITVAPAAQGQGWGRRLLDALRQAAPVCAAQQLWLEVRASNARALHLYQRFGFERVSVRKAYYPAGRGSAREDAVVMRLPL